MFGYLLSFHYFRSVDLDELARSSGREDLTFFVDSGAFSAYTLGTPVVLEEYAAWLERWSHRIHRYATLDVMYDPQGTQRNTQRLQAMGLTPFPVFHVGSPLDVFQDYLTEHPFVAVGGMVSSAVSTRSPRLWKYLSQLHGLAQQAGVALHGFGLSSWPLIRRFPWRSVDSSTPCAGFRYGRIDVFDPYRDRWHQWGLRDRQAWHCYGWLVREYGYAPSDFHGSNVDIREALVGIAARSWSRAARALSAQFYLVDTPPPGNPGSAAQRLARWERGNRWTPELYVVDSAFDQREPGHPTRLSIYDRNNRWQQPGCVPEPATPCA